MTDLEHQVLVNLIAEYGGDVVADRVADIIADADEDEEEREVPYDTPSLDTSFHDHEMDVG